MTDSDVDIRQRKLDDALRRYGASMVGVCSVSDLGPEVCKKLPVGIAIAVDYDRTVLNGIGEDDRALLRVSQYSRSRMHRLYGIACQLLRSWGYSFMPIHDDTLAELLPNYTSEVPLKTLATKSGLGWVGKSGLLITTRYGPRVRLGGILTDAPFEPAKPITESKCGNCSACVEACPAEAIKGAHWFRGIDRSELLAAEKCNEWRCQTLASLGRKSECALCLASCPMGAESSGSNWYTPSTGTASVGSQPRATRLVSVAMELLKECELTPEELAFLEQDDDLLSDEVSLVDEAFELETIGIVDPVETLVSMEPAEPEPVECISIPDTCACETCTQTGTAGGAADHVEAKPDFVEFVEESAGTVASQDEIATPSECTPEVMEVVPNEPSNDTVVSIEPLDEPKKIAEYTKTEVATASENPAAEAAETVQPKDAPRRPSRPRRRPPRPRDIEKPNEVPQGQGTQD